MSSLSNKNAKCCARSKIINAAFDLFHERGIHATSVDDILKKSATGKSQFYHYFGSKEGLVRAVMEGARNQINDGSIAGISSIETWDDLKCWFDFSLDSMACHEYNRSCPMGRFASDLSKGDEAVRSGVVLVFETVKQHPKEFFIKIHARGELKPEADPDAMADFCVSIVQGACLVSKVYRDRAPLDNSLDAAFSYLRSLLK